MNGEVMHIDDETELNITRAKGLMGIAYETVAELMRTNAIRSWYRGERLVTCRREIRLYHEREAARRAEEVVVDSVREERVMTIRKEKSDEEKAAEHYRNLFAA
jgi:hypothetical protein